MPFKGWGPPQKTKKLLFLLDSPCLKLPEKLKQILQNVIFNEILSKKWPSPSTAEYGSLVPFLRFGCEEIFLKKIEKNFNKKNKLQNNYGIIRNDEDRIKHGLFS